MVINPIGFGPSLRRSQGGQGWEAKVSPRCPKNGPKGQVETSLFWDRGETVVGPSKRR
jgi:hypothetical protein